jgi:hypothetical protein
MVVKLLMQWMRVMLEDMDITRKFTEDHLA